MDRDEKLNRILKAIEDMHLELDALKSEVEYLRSSDPATEPKSTSTPKAAAKNVNLSTEPKIEEVTPPKIIPKKEKEPPPPPPPPKAKPEPEPSTFNLEEYIGGNILAKIGIFILILGLGIFVKYAVDHNLISPLGRMILSYSAGLLLIFLSYYLKSKYLSFSAVLLSGGVATLYFTTYIGHNFFLLIPQGLAFLLMFLCTAFTVYQARLYSQEIIGIVGLVGAYAVPILIGKEGGNVNVLFIYISIVNGGMLLVARQ
ncbi:MAG: DUF2339 domain-containing protein, partial [Bacteroidota bacterium]